MSKLSVIIPAYNEEAAITKAADVIVSVLSSAGIDYELVFVNDGSRDNTLPLLEKLCSERGNITVVSFSRNFGKEAAIFAGLANAAGDCCAVIDCDLQHPPEVLVKMYRLWEDGYEIIEGIKRTRGRESVLHKAGVGLFYGLISKALRKDMSRASDFKLMDRRVVDTILSVSEANVFFRALSAWVGYRTAEVEFDVCERVGGETKWSSLSLIKYAIRNIAAYSSAPMQAVTVVGVVAAVASLVVGIVDLCRLPAAGVGDLIVFLLLLIGSIIMISLGIIGYYISKIYEEVKRRPRYIISKIIKNQK